jgi:protein-disulfide isomerase
MKTINLIASALVAGNLLSIQIASAQTAPAQDELVDQVTQSVLEALRNSGELERAIDEGIERYVERQRAARTRQEEAQQQRLATTLRPADPDRDHIFGNPLAPVSLIEYSDFECPFCKRFHPTAEALVAAYPDKVNWVYRHFPLGFHNPAAQREAEASECVAELAGNEAFWRYSNAIYATTPSNGKGIDKAGLTRLAKDQGVDAKRFTECLASSRHAKRVEEDFRQGQAVGVTGTPGNFLRDNRSGRTLVRPGAVDLEHLKRDVATLLEDNG